MRACVSESSVALHKRSALVGTEDCVFDSVSLCGSSYGVFGVYILASSALTRLVAFMRVWGSKLVGMCALNVPPGALGRQANQGPYTRLPLGV